MIKNSVETPDFLTCRPRRNRRLSSIRSLVQETALLPANLAAPLFITENPAGKEPIPSLPDIFRFSIDELVKETVELYRLGIRAVDLFPVVPKEKKDAYGSEALRQGNLLERALKRLKQEIPEMCLMVDIALDPYTDHGHDGLVDEKGRIDNDSTLQILSDISVRAAEAGADIVAPSDMMDGRVAHIRKSLDAAGFSETGILSYAAKYASSLYGPFRDALGSGVAFGDKKTYQMDPANAREAVLESRLDESEGADMLLIKPALSYLDVIAKVRAETNLPIGAYHVSGEYSMVLAAAEKGWLDADKVLMEHLVSIKRAGADFILTYAAKKCARTLAIF